jgi:heme A synthase
MRAVYRVLATVVLAGVVVQLASMAFGAFTTSADAEDGAAIDGAYNNAGQTLHQIGGMAIGGVVLLLLIVSFFAKVPGGVKWAGALVGLVVVQIALATIAFSIPLLGALHALNAMAIATVAERAARAAKQGDAVPAGATAGS